MNYSKGDTAHDTEHVSLKADVKTLKAQVLTLQGQVSTLQGQMTTANSNITTLQGQIIGSGAWASRPGSPTAFQRYFATDRGIEYYWDATGSRWLSVQNYTTNLSTQTTADIPQGTVAFSGVLDRNHTLGGVLLTGIHCLYVCRLTQSSAAMYGITAAYVTAGATVTTGITLTGTLDTRAQPINTYNNLDYPLSLVLPTNAFRVSMVCTVQGTAGTYLFVSTVSYKMIG